jgi:hypothetical protein
MHSSCCGRYEKVGTRREFLTKSGFGFGGLALTYLLGKENAFGASLADANRFNPLGPKTPHFPAKAKNVIFLFMQGGPSHIDTFDPKPVLNRLDGQLLPPSFQAQGLDLQFIKASEAKLMGTRFPFKKYGKSGLEISDVFVNIAQHADELAVIRSCYHDSFAHSPALNILHSGSVRLGHPSVGSWVLYGLGAETDNLPAYIVMSDGGDLRAGKSAFASGFLPAAYQGTMVQIDGAPFENLNPPPQIDQTQQRIILDQVNKWNRRHLEDSRNEDTRLAARIANYELAFRMQMAAPELIDTSKEPEHVKKMYGLDQETTKKFGRMCLLARRMVERGVRFVQLYNMDWDGHAECEKNHQKNAWKIDKPISGLVGDLKQRGLLESTLIVWTGEFGRTPVMQGKQGRDHNPYGFCTWMAGGGIRGGKVIGATDELGFRAVEDKVHVNDLHATMLWLLGLDHKKLTYSFQGRDQRLTDVGGENNLAERLLRV